LPDGHNWGTLPAGLCRHGRFAHERQLSYWFRLAGEIRLLFFGARQN